MKIIVSLWLCVTYCFAGLWSTAEIRLNPEKYNYSVATITDLPEKTTEPSEDGFAGLSQMKMHYEVYGSSGRPMILIHGNGGNANSLRHIAEFFGGEYTVYLIESRCHGQSTDTDVITYDLMADDVAEFITKLQLDKPVIMGHSDGAIVALSLASRHPELPGCVISCGANSRPESAWFQFRFWVHWENLLEKDKLNDLMLSGPDFTEEFLGKITCPVYVVSGEKDLMPVADTYYMYENIPNADITVFKGEDHGSYLDGGKGYTLAKLWLDSLDK